jgi:hypothetical protein
MAGGIFVFMHAERLQESGDNYRAYNPSGHYGAYQFGWGAWDEALQIAGSNYASYRSTRPDQAPNAVQDAAAHALMGLYYGQFGQSWYNVAEAWYGGPGAVGHPDWGGGPGYPNVGQYAAQVIAKYNQLAGTSGGGGAPPQAGLHNPLDPGYARGLEAWYIDVIEPMGKVWRDYSRPLPASFYYLPAPVR